MSANTFFKVFQKGGASVHVSTPSDCQYRDCLRFVGPNYTSTTAYVRKLDMPGTRDHMYATGDTQYTSMFGLVNELKTHTDACH